LGKHGTWVFISLTSGKEIHGRTFTPLPVTDEVIGRVEEMAEQQGLPIVHDGQLLYEWRPGQLIDDGDHDLEEPEDEIIDDEDDVTPDVNNNVRYASDTDEQSQDDETACVDEIGAPMEEAGSIDTLGAPMEDQGAVLKEHPWRTKERSSKKFLKRWF